MTDPECTTDAPFGNDEECILCECRPKGTTCADIPEAQCVDDSDCSPNEDCSDCHCVVTGCSADSACTSNADCPQGEACGVVVNDTCSCSESACVQPGACTDDADCPDGQTCSLCQCESGCECEVEGDCTAPQTCDGCNCVDPPAGCAMGDATAPSSPDVTVSGTNITAPISGNPADCPILLCSFTATNNTSDYITFGVMESLPSDASAPMPIVSVAAAGETVEFEVWANDCTTPTTLDRTLFVADEVNGISLGNVPLLWQTVPQ